MVLIVHLLVAQKVQIQYSQLSHLLAVVLALVQLLVLLLWLVLPLLVRLLPPHHRNIAVRRSEFRGAHPSPETR